MQPGARPGFRGIPPTPFPGFKLDFPTATDNQYRSLGGQNPVPVASYRTALLPGSGWGLKAVVAIEQVAQPAQNAALAFVFSSPLGGEPKKV